MKNIISTVSLSVALTALGIETASAVTAEQIFPPHLNGAETKGVYVRKGTLGATFANILALDKLLAMDGQSTEIRAIMKDQRELSKSIQALDVFELQPIEGWLQDRSRQGKVLVAVMTLKDCPMLMTDRVRRLLEEQISSGHPIVQAEIQKVLGIS